MTTEQSNLNFPLSIQKIIDYNPSATETITHNKEQINLLIQDIQEELKEIPMPDINLIRKMLKKKSKKFILGSDFNIGNVVSFGANIDDVENSYNLIMMPYIGESNAFIKFRYYPKSRNFVNLFNKLLMALRTEKINYSYDIDKGQKPNYIRLTINDEHHNEKFWYVMKLWSRN